MSPCDNCGCSPGSGRAFFSERTVTARKRLSDGSGGTGPPAAPQKFVVTPRKLYQGLAVAIVCAALLFALYRISLVITVPDEAMGMSPSAGGLGVAVHELLGRPGPSDLVIDYAGARAMTHGGDAYAVSAGLIKDVGMDWPVFTANPHPPTVLPVVLPLTLFNYNRAAEIWAFAMIGTFIATIRLLGVRWLFAISAGLGLTLTMPGAYAIGNVVPLIGFGAAIAYRFRDDPWLAGLGIAMAAAPKASGLVLLVPFVLSGRLKPVGWAAGFYGLLAAIPIFFQHDVWGRYLDAGLRAVAANAGRSDNASLIKLSQHWSLPSVLILTVIALAAIVLALASRDTYWPAVWLMVAALPIGWLYSLVTLVPIGAHIFRRRPTPLSLALVLVATGLTLASPPLGNWPVVVFPVVTALAYLSILAAPDPESAFPTRLARPHRATIGRSGGRSHENAALGHRSR